MWTCGSKQLRGLLWAALGLLGVAAVIFHGLQNAPHAVGGAIALPKLLWLALALWFWYVLPLLFVLDARLRPTRALHALFAANMLARALIELWMMYVSSNWHPYYGIAHDLFSAALVLYLSYALPFDAPLLGAQRSFFLVLGLMFLLETGFAVYMLNNVHSLGPVYFVPTGAAHRGVLTITWVAVGALLFYAVALIKEWLYVPLKR